MAYTLDGPQMDFIDITVITNKTANLFVWFQIEYLKGYLRESCLESYFILIW